jgi:predicted nuclease with TOPRIM domain
MSLPAFDTLKYAEQLEKSGFTREQSATFARAQLESLKELMEEKLVTKELLFEVKQELLEKLATKEGVKYLREELKSEVKSVRDEVKTVRDELKSDIKCLRDEMKWLFGATIAILTLVMSAFKFLH